MKKSLVIIFLISSILTTIVVSAFVGGIYEEFAFFENSNSNYLELEGNLDVDGFLLSRSVPQYVIDSMHGSKRNTIYYALRNYPNAVFGFFSQEDIYFDDERDMHFIPRADLTLSASGFRGAVASDPGVYMIFPSFRWHRNANIQNDRFAFTLNGNNWVTITGAVGSVHMNITGRFSNVSQTFHIDRPSASSFFGQSYTFLTGINNTQFEGTAVMYARRVPNGDLNDRQIMISYAHDRSAFNNTPIGVTLDIFYISFTPSSGNVITTSEIISW